MTGFRLRYLGPVVFVTLCLIILCAATAVSLFTQQESVTRVLRENVESKRAAVELGGCLLDLIELENNQVENIAVLHDRSTRQLVTIRQLSDQPEEQRIATQLETAFREYLRRWSRLPPVGDSGHEAARRDATKYLEVQVLKPCQEFEHYNTGRIDTSTLNHENFLRQLAWGMAGIGGLGAVAGLVLGYGVARGLSRSIRRLRVQLHDAAGKLDRKSAEIVFTEQGDFQQLHSEVADLTVQIEQMVQELQQREYELLRSEQLAAVGQLAAGVAHEIRNPLTAIKMLVQSAQEGTSDLTPEDLRIIESEIRRAEQSLQSFLDFARPPKLVRSSTDLIELIRTVMTLLRGRLEKQQIEVQLDLPQSVIPMTVDGERIRRVILNLCWNALDAMPQGGRLTVRTAVRPTKQVVLVIEDTGPGISKLIFPRLFEPFASSKDTGLGLGLAISKRIVEDHGGSISVVNRLEGGATFFVKLPTEVTGGGIAHR